MFEGGFFFGPVPGRHPVSTTMNMICSHVLKVGCVQPENLADLDRKLQMFWDLDTLGVREKEDSIYDKFIRTVELKNGRYSVPNFHGMNCTHCCQITLISARVDSLIF